MSLWSSVERTRDWVNFQYLMGIVYPVECRPTTTAVPVRGAVDPPPRPGCMLIGWPAAAASCRGKPRTLSATLYGGGVCGRAVEAAGGPKNSLHQPGSLKARGHTSRASSQSTARNRRFASNRAACPASIVCEMTFPLPHQAWRCTSR